MGEPVSLSVGDFNNDGRLDIAAATFFGPVAVLLGNGNGTFQPAVYYQIASAYSVAVGDFNHDGTPDLVVGDQGEKRIEVLLGNGDGTFQPPLPFPTTAQPTDVVIGDFNHDGNPDVAVCDEPYVSVLLGNGDGTLQAPLDNNIRFCSQATGSVIAVGDFNRDGKADIAVVSNDVDILLGNGDGTFELAGEYFAGEFSQSLTVGDFNGDHKLDLAVTNGSGNQIYIFLGNGDGTFDGLPPFFADGPGAIEAADMNGDGNLDLVFLTAAAPFPANSATVLFGNGDGTFRPGGSYEHFREGSFVAVGDFNGDHQPDLAVADDLGNAVGVLLNTGVVSFSPSTPLRFPRQLVGTTSPSQSVKLTNTGTSSLSIFSISVKGPFLLKQNCGSSVEAASSCTLSAKFQPVTPANVGGLISISDSASPKPQVIELRGGGTVVTVSPAQLTFAAQKVGTKSAAQMLTVTNTGSTAVDVASVKLAGRNPYDFSVQNNCGAQIAPGGSCTLSVSFTPTAKGARRAAAEINDDGGASPQGAQLNGSGD